MGGLFLRIFNMSISATYIALAVMLLRLLLKKAPKKITLILWGIVGLRLIMPFTFESVFSLIPSGETVSPNIVYAQAPTIYSGIPALNHAVNPIISESLAPQIGESVNPLQVWVPIIAFVWLLGMAAMLTYALTSYILLKKRVSTAILTVDNIYTGESVFSPFVLGFFKPKIYLPSNIASGKVHVIAHERAHIKSFDHIIKPLGFIILALHWFNPIIWISYILFCKDIELACDERVIRDLDLEERANYSQALLGCAASHKAITACPLAFGEVSVKNRVKSILSYKKPAFWIIIIAVLLILVLSVCFLTNPVGMRLVDISDSGLNITLLDDISEITISSDNGFHCKIITDRAEIDELVGLLMKLKISREPISTSRSEERPSEKLIMLNSRTVLHFNDVLSEVYIDDTVKPSFSYKVLNPDIIEDIFSEYRLTLDEVLELSTKKDALTWSDFDGYYHTVTGSGLYIECYPIDDMFSVWIGGTNEEEKPMYIYLKASDGLDMSIDIRSEDVQKYIDEHKDNPIVKQHSFSFSSCAVGYNDAIWEFMWSASAKPMQMTLSSKRCLPHLVFTSRSQLDSFLKSASGMLNFNKAYEDTVTLNDTVKKFDDEFFEAGNTLVIAYAVADNLQERFCVKRISTVDMAMGEIEIGKLITTGPADTAMEGFLMFIDCGTLRVADLLNFYVHRTD